MKLYLGDELKFTTEPYHEGQGNQKSCANDPATVSTDESSSDFRHNN